MGVLKNIGDATKAAIKKELEGTEVESGFKQFKNTAKEKLEKNGIISSNQSREPRLSSREDNDSEIYFAEPYIEEKEAIGFCPNCGKELTEKSKFCPGCGKQLDGKGANEEVRNNKVQDNSIRHQEYVGKVYKCPNCGEVVNPELNSCPTCGFRFTGKGATSSVQQFSERLMEIEESRWANKKRASERNKTFGVALAEEFFGSTKVDPDEADERILALIKSFPIPSSIDDIVEFMHLSVGNINVQLSKKKNILTAKNYKSMEEKISDAWVSKMEQLYEMAKIHFPKEPAFEHVKQIYESKMRELKLL